MKIANNIDDLKRQYEQTGSGYWFTPDAMRFFRTRFTEQYRVIDDTTAVFITTEWNSVSHERKATIRVTTLTSYTRDDGRQRYKINIKTHGDFCTLTLARAKTVLKNLRKEDLCT